MAGPNVGGAAMQSKEPFSIKRFFGKKSNIFLLVEGIFFAWFIFSFLIYPNLNLFADVLFSGGLGDNINKILESERAMQAIKNSFPAIGNEFVVNIKDSSVLSAISVTDLYFQSIGVAGSIFRFTETMTVTASVYLVLTFTTTRILGLIERRMGRPRSSFPASQTMPGNPTF